MSCDTYCKVPPLLDRTPDAHSQRQRMGLGDIPSLDTVAGGGRPGAGREGEGEGGGEGGGGTMASDGFT